MNLDYLFKGLLAVMTIVIGFLLSNIYFTVSDLQKSNTQIKISLQKLQSETLTREDVKDMIWSQIYKYKQTYKEIK